MKLDIACGWHKDEGWVGIDIQRLPGVDIVHDLNVHPWPIEAESVDQAKAWHIIEHIPPTCVTAPQGGDETSSQVTRWPFIEFMDECWRVLKVGARLDIEAPYGFSDGFVHDPTHCNPVDELTFEYFDPACRRFECYRPRPWKIVTLWFTLDGNVNVVLEKRMKAEG